MLQWRTFGFLVMIGGAGCGGRPPAGGAGGPGGAGGGAGAASSTLVPQSQRASQYPAGKADYWCQWREGNKYLPTTYASQFTVEAKQVTAFTRSGKDSTVFPLDASDGAYVRARSAPEDEQRSLVLADKLIFAMVEKPGAQPEIEYVCSAKEDQARVARTPAATHLAQLQAYAAERQQTYDATPHDDAELGAALADFNVDLDAEAEAAAKAEAAKPKWTPEQAAKLARGRTMTSFTFTATQRDQRSRTSLGVTMKLADGSTLTSGLGDPVFFGLFAWSTIPMVQEDKGVIIQVWPRGEDGERVEDRVQQLMVPFSFDTQRGFTCQGEPGPNGVDRNWNNSGMMFYTGQQGAYGPDITVEITTVGDATPQVLRYRLSCGAKREVFNASPTSPVEVTTIGGKGGHGIPRANGDGTSGGRGGDGGNITVIADPSVKSYTVVHSSIGGKGGNSSDKSQTNDSTERDTRRGAEGSPGSFDEKRAPVTIP